LTTWLAVSPLDEVQAHCQVRPGVPEVGTKELAAQVKLMVCEYPCVWIVEDSDTTWKPPDAGHSSTVVLLPGSEFHCAASPHPWRLTTMVVLDG
jgi:hypothetical protein